MKKLLSVLIAAMMLFACKKAENVRELPGDPELVNEDMDRMAAAMRKPPKPTHPHDQPPSTTKKVCFLLDFNGEVVSNTLWQNYSTFTCANSGLDPQQIASIVARVKYDWQQFDAEITTDEAVFNSYPLNKRRRCILTTTTWYGNVGGVAYINSMNWFDNTPCFVFTPLLGYNSKFTSDATSHELGHTAGCRHISDWQYYEDGSCFKRNEYLVGAMIMGYSYYYPTPQFGSGPSSAGCYITENNILNINNSINQ